MLTRMWRLPGDGWLGNISDLIARARQRSGGGLRVRSVPNVRSCALPPKQRNRDKDATGGRLKSLLPRLTILLEQLATRLSDREPSNVLRFFRLARAPLRPITRMALIQWLLLSISPSPATAQ